MNPINLKDRGSCGLMNRQMSYKRTHATLETTARSVVRVPTLGGMHQMSTQNAADSRSVEAGEPNTYDTRTSVLRKDSMSPTSECSMRSQSTNIGSSLEQSMWSLTSDDASDASSDLAATIDINDYESSPACRHTANILRRNALSGIDSGEEDCSRQARKCNKPSHDFPQTLWDNTCAALSKLRLVPRPLRNPSYSNALAPHEEPAFVASAPGLCSVPGRSRETPHEPGAMHSNFQQQQQQQQQQKLPIRFPQGWDPAAVNGKRMAKADQTSSQARFPCVLHKWGVAEDDTDTCKTKQAYVSRLRVHHSAQGHEGGPFIYCQKCYSKDFNSTEEADQHIQACRIQICIHEQCPNYGLDPGPGGACNRHCATPSQRLKWRKLYRLAHGLDLTAEIPETGGGSPRPATPVSSRPRTIRSPSASLHSAAMSRGNSHGSHGARSRSTSRAADQPLFSTPSPAEFIQDLSLPVGSPVIPGSSVSPVSPTLQLLAEVGKQLEDLAKCMLRAVVNGDNTLDPAQAGWYDAIMPPAIASHENETPSGADVARLALRNRTLREAIEEYRRLIEDPAYRLPTRWFTVRSLTLHALGVALSEETPSAWALRDLASAGTSRGEPSLLHGSTSIPIPQRAFVTHSSPVPSLTFGDTSSSTLLSHHPSVAQQMAHHAPLSHELEMFRHFSQSNLQIPLQSSFAGRSAYTYSQGSGSRSDPGRTDAGYVSGSSPGKDSFNGLPHHPALEQQD